MLNKKGVCPILKGDAVERFGMSEGQVANWCKLGCSVDCGELLEQRMTKKSNMRNTGEMELI